MTKKMIDKGERSKALNGVMPVEKINKNPQSFLEISLMQDKIFSLLKLEAHAYE